MSESARSKRMPISVGSLLWIALIVWLLTPGNGASKRQIEALRGEVAELRQELGLLRKAIGQRSESAADVERPRSLALDEHGDLIELGSGAGRAKSERGNEPVRATSGESMRQAAAGNDDLESQAVERE